VTNGRLADQQYRELLAFRSGLRRFLRWSEEQAIAAGVTAQQHQLLLAVRGHAGPDAPTIGDIADHLLIRHHSAVELADRAASAGLVDRVVDRDDRRVVHLHLTAKGADILAHLSAAHLEELARLAPLVQRLTTDVDDPWSPPPIDP
jgi:DNA-binding MarR family transcriptional regulator